jgi:protein with PEP-CTERM/exosortase system signal
MSETATWALDGTSGTFTSDYTLTSSSPTAYIVDGPSNIPSGGNPDDLYDTVGTPPNWGFEFTAEASGNFVLDCDSTATGFLFGLQGFNLSGIYSPTYASEHGGQGYLDADINSSGEFVAPVVAGQTYTLFLGEQSNYGGSGLDATGSVDADFSWTLPGAARSVPDGDATIAMLGAVFAGLAVLRRRFGK